MAAVPLLCCMGGEDREGRKRLKTNFGIVKFAATVRFCSMLSGLIEAGRGSKAVMARLLRWRM